MNKNIDHLKCVLCGGRYEPAEAMYTCEQCGPFGLLNVVYKYAEIKKEFEKKISKPPAHNENNIWRYIDILPVAPETPKTSLRVGMTPYYKPERLAKFLNHENIFIKDDGQNPTASFKDRASAVGVSKSFEFKKDIITCASTGNAASSLSGICAQMGIKTYIFVPKTAPVAKVAQLLLFGANVLMVDGNYDQAFDLCMEASKEFGWYNRNTGYNPYLLEGKKTCALEIFEQSGRKLPDYVFVSVGDGCIIGGIYKGFYDLMNLGLIEKVPKLIGVQAEGSNPFVRAFKNNKSRQLVDMVPETVADSISVGIPRASHQGLNAVYASEGEFMDVTDTEILDALKTLPKYAGVFAEPAGVTGFAGFVKMKKENRIHQNASVAIVVTGNGLKDINTAISCTTKPPVVEPSLTSVKKALKM